MDVIVEELASGMAWLRAGKGAPLLFLPGLTPHHGVPRSFDRLGTELMMRHLVRLGREVHWINRRPGLATGTTMADLARDYAELIRSRFQPPVDVLGHSTGGGLALQLAVDSPELVSRLIVVASAYRLGDDGRTAQRRFAQALAAGRPRSAAAAIFPPMGAWWPSRRLLGALGWLVGKDMYGGDNRDVLAVVAAEDTLNLSDRLPEISVPTLLVAGQRDGYYAAELFAETAALIPGAQLRLHRRKGHLGITRKVAADIEPFLSAT